MVRLFLPVVLAGCAQHWQLDENDLSCKFNPHNWYDGLPYTLQHSDRSGAFGFNPGGKEVKRRKGRYDVDTGEFWWRDTYVEGHSRIWQKVEGVGTVWHNGDLDLRLTLTTEDVLGEQTRVGQRIERTGCRGTIKTWDADEGDDAPVSTWTTRIVSDKRVVHTLDLSEGEQTWVRTENYHRGYRRDTEITWDDGRKSYLDAAYSWRADGTGDGTWEDGNREETREGISTFYLDGSWSQDYTVYDRTTGDEIARVYVLWQYDGSASGTYTFVEGRNEEECDLEVRRNGQCTVDCGRDEYDCG